MILDLTKLLEVPYIEWIVLGVLALILLFTVIITTSRGIVRCLFDLVYIGGFIAGLLFGMPYLVNVLASTGFVELIQSKVTMLSSIDPGLVYSIIALVIILIVVIIVAKILNLIFKKAFVTKGKGLVKFFGFIYGLIFFFVFSTFLLEVISSPFICRNGDKLIESSPIVAVYKDKVTDPLQEVLHEQECVSVVEDYFLMRDDSIASAEDLTAARDALASVRLLITDKAAYESSLKNVGGLSEEKVELAIDQLYYVTDLITEGEGYLSSKVAQSLEVDFEAWLAMFDGKTITVNNASKVMEIADMLGSSEEVRATITEVFQA